MINDEFDEFMNRAGWSYGNFDVDSEEESQQVVAQIQSMPDTNNSARSMKDNKLQDKFTSKYSSFSDAKLKKWIEELLPETKPFISVEHTKYIDFYQAGLEYEIRLVEKEEREQRITLHDGKIISSDTVTTVRFKTDEILMLMVDSPIQIQFQNSTQLEATYIGQDPVNMTVDLTVEGNVPEHLLERVTILSSSSALLKRLAKRFLEWENGELKREPNLSPHIFNGTFKTSIISPKYSIPNSISLNLEQKDALARTCAPGIALIWGPPGTGKTTVLSLSIVNALEQNKRVLLASNTNKAIDHALNKVIDHIEDNIDLFPNAHKQLGEDLLLRFREIRTDSVYDKLNPRVSLKAIANKKAGGIHEQIETIRGRLKEIEEQLRKTGAVISELQNLKENIENLESQKRMLDDRKQKLTESETAKQNLYAKLTSITDTLGVLEEEVSKLKSDEKKYVPLKEAYAVLAGGSELSKMLEKKKDIADAIMKLEDQRGTLERVLKNERPKLDELIKCLEQYTNNHRAINSSIRIHEDIVLLVKEGKEIDLSLNLLNTQLGKHQSELSELEDAIARTRAGLDELIKSAFSRLRNRTAIRDLENTLSDNEGRRENAIINISQCREQLNSSKANATTRKNMINGLLIANKEKIRELIGQEYSFELINSITSVR